MFISLANSLSYIILINVVNVILFSVCYSVLYLYIDLIVFIVFNLCACDACFCFCVWCCLLLCFQCPSRQRGHCRLLLRSGFSSESPRSSVTALGGLDWHGIKTRASQWKDRKNHNQNATSAS